MRESHWNFGIIDPQHWKLKIYSRHTWFIPFLGKAILIYFNIFKNDEFSASESNDARSWKGSMSHWDTPWKLAYAAHASYVWGIGMYYTIEDNCAHVSEANYGQFRQSNHAVSPKNDALTPSRPTLWTITQFFG